MPNTPNSLRVEVDKALADNRPADALCYLAELCAVQPDNRQARVALAIALGDAGYPVGALRVLRAAADHLANQGFLLPAMVVVRHGLAHAPDDPSLVSTLKRLHVRGVRARAGTLPVPPPLRSSKAPPEAVTAEALLALEPAARFERATEAGTQFPPTSHAAPVPLPLFSELDPEAFVETVRTLHYKRLPAGTKLLAEGEPGNTLLVIANGEVRIEKDGQRVATLGAGAVLGEMALITGAPRSATAVGETEVEIFELSRDDVNQLATSKPQIAQELVEYCRNRLLANLLRTSPLFARFDEDTRFGLLQRFQRQGFQPGGTVITQGQPGLGLYVVATGEVEVRVAQDGGEAVVVANLGPGDVFGEISLLRDQPTNATVVSRGRTGALFLPRDEFQRVVAEHPEVGSYLTGLTEDRLKASSNVLGGDDVLDADDLIVL